MHPASSKSRNRTKQRRREKRTREIARTYVRKIKSSVSITARLLYCCLLPTACCYCLRLTTAAAGPCPPRPSSGLSYSVSKRFTHGKKSRRLRCLGHRWGYLGTYLRSLSARRQRASSRWACRTWGSGRRLFGRSQHCYHDECSLTHAHTVF